MLTGMSSPLRIDLKEISMFLFALRRNFATEEYESPRVPYSSLSPEYCDRARMTSSLA